MAAAMTLMAKQRGDVRFVQTSMYYPVTDAARTPRPTTSSPRATTSPRKAMDWFWDAYIPDLAARARSPPRRNQATTEQLPACRRPSCWSTRPTRCATRAKPTPPSSAWPGSPVTTVRYDGMSNPPRRPSLSCAPRSAPAERGRRCSKDSPNTDCRRRSGVDLRAGRRERPAAVAAARLPADPPDVARGGAGCWRSGHGRRGGSARLRESFRPAPAPTTRRTRSARWPPTWSQAMAALGFERFAVAGHDRGGRVAYRMALDHPDGSARWRCSTSCRRARCGLARTRACAASTGTGRSSPSRRRCPSA